MFGDLAHASLVAIARELFGEDQEKASKGGVPSPEICMPPLEKVSYNHLEKMIFTGPPGY